MTEGEAGRSVQTSERVYPQSLLNVAFALAAVAGVLHLYIGIGIVIDGLPMGAALVLIALVYFGGIGLIAANYRRELFLTVGLGWVLLLLVLWALTAVVNIQGSGARDPFAYAEKADEVVLLGLVVWIRRSRTRR